MWTRLIRNRQDDNPSENYWLRITTLNQQMTTIVHEKILPELQKVMIMGHEFMVTDIATRPDQHPWADSTTDETLIFEHTLMEKYSPRMVTLQFVSPTFFKSDINPMFPVAANIFGTLHDRWQHFNDVQLHPDARRFANECVDIYSYRIRSRYKKFHIGEHSVAVNGFVGQTKFRISHNDYYWRRIIETLANYSFYAGIGARTTMGFGQCRTIDDDFPARSS